ncbi:MAG: cyclophilin-like fold protein [Chloroflexota bacterium]
MTKRIEITAGNVRVKAELNDSATAEAIWRALPIAGEANTWGDEIYFETPVDQELEPGAKADVEIGSIAYWPPGSALCLFFGRTPASRGDRPRAASPVNVVGSILGDATVLRRVADGMKVRVARAA